MVNFGTWGRAELVCLYAAYSPRLLDFTLWHYVQCAASASLGLNLSYLCAPMPAVAKPKPKAPNFRNTESIAKALGVALPQLTYFIYALPASERYKRYLITSKSGRPRRISAPIPPIKDLQTKLLKLLEPAYIPRTQVHGYIRERSPLTNADVHKYQTWVLHVDVADFFPSITKRRVRGLFRRFPFFYSASVAEYLAQLCTWIDELPQGAPTSPLISNLICRGLDARLAKLASENRCFYSRYCDDVTFSTRSRSFPSNLATLDESSRKVQVGLDLQFIFETEGFSLRPEKSTLRHRTEHQMVTGLTVNQFANVPRKYIRSLRNLLFIWSTYGKAAAQASFEEQWQPNRPPGKDVPTLEDIIRGRIQYVGSVKGWYDPIYRRFANTFSYIDKSYSPTDKHSERPKTVLAIHCEGKSDVKHLHAAWRIFRTKYPQLEPRFFDASSDGELLKRMQTFSSVSQSIPIVGLFDRDNDKIIKQVQPGAGGFKRWARGVYSFALPTPLHHRDDEKLCIELMHLDSTLALKDENGRRVFKRSEFKENGFHTDGRAVMIKSGGSSLIATEVRDTSSQENIALSKDNFAEQIAKKKRPFHDIDMSGFEVIFSVLCDIRQRWLTDRLEPF